LSGVGEAHNKGLREHNAGALEAMATGDKGDLTLILWYERGDIGSFDRKNRRKNVKAMANEPQNEAQDEPLGAGQRTGPTEQWVRNASAAGDDIPAIDKHQARVLTGKLRGKWSYVDSITIERKAGRNWVDTGLALIMPEGRDGVSPEGGAAEIVKMAREYWTAHDGRWRVRVNVMGHSQSGETAKSLFVLMVDFNEQEDEDEPETAGAKATEKSRREKDIETLGAMETMRSAVNDAMGNWQTAIGKVEKLADKIVELADQASKNQTAMVEGMRLTMQDKREQREDDARQREEETNAKRVDAVLEQLLAAGGSVFEDWLRAKVSPDVVDGSFSSRLAAMFELMDSEQLKKAEEILGEEAWQILRDASGGVEDAAFRTLMHKAAAAIPGDTQATVAQLMTILPQDLFKAFVKLLHEASK